MAKTNDFDVKQPLIPHRVNIVYGSQPLAFNIRHGSNEDQTTQKNSNSKTMQKDGISSMKKPVADKKEANVEDELYRAGFKSGSDGTILNYEQATTLMITLENTKNVIENYLHTLEQYHDRSTPTPSPRRKSWWGLHCWPQKRKWLYRYITIVTVTLQFLNLLILSLLDAWPKPKEERPYLVASSVTMIILQLINLFFLILASGRLVKQIYRNSVNSVFLAQTYGATILLFAGLYTLTYRLQRQSWRFVNENLYEDPIQVFILYAKFLFYSISTATLCGSDNVLPEEWFNCLFAGFQMLLSFCYFASILGSAMCHDNVRLPTIGNPPSSVSAQKYSTDNNNHPCHQNHHFHRCHQHECSAIRQENGHSTIARQVDSDPPLQPNHNFDDSIDWLTPEAGELSHVLSIEMPGNANIDDRTGKCSIKKQQNHMVDVDVLNSRHVQVNPSTHSNQVTHDAPLIFLNTG